jgi:hypothetical protein
MTLPCNRHPESRFAINDHGLKTRASKQQRLLNRLAGEKQKYEERESHRNSTVREKDPYPTPLVSLVLHASRINYILSSFILPHAPYSHYINFFC